MSDFFGFCVKVSTLLPSTLTVPFSLGFDDVVSIIVATAFCFT
ncbi:MAG: hypothetical protein AABX33_04555 [Nanoarchaeota archaeon]